MDLVWLIVYAIVAGAAVTLASGLSRRMNEWGGVVAAAPVTPTFAVILLVRADRVPDLVAGLPSIMATLVVLSIATGVVTHVAGRGRVKAWVSGLAGRVPAGLFVVLFVPPLALLFARWLPEFLVIGGLFLSALVAGHCLRNRDSRDCQEGVTVREKSGSGGGRMAFWLRFVLGASSVLLVAAAVKWMPSLAALMALFPLVFTAGLLLAQFDGGRQQAVRVMAGGVPGSMGVAAFAGTVTLLGVLGVRSVVWILLAGWGAYVGASILWREVQQVLQPIPRRQRPREPTPIPARRAQDPAGHWVR